MLGSTEALTVVMAVSALNYFLVMLACNPLKTEQQELLRGKRLKNFSNEAIQGLFFLKKEFMAHLEVKPRNGAPKWLWILLSLIALGLVVYFVNRNNTDDRLPESTPDTSINSTAPQRDTL